MLSRENLHQYQMNQQSRQKIDVLKELSNSSYSVTINPSNIKDIVIALECIDLIASQMNETGKIDVNTWGMVNVIQEEFFVNVCNKIYPLNKEALK